MGILLYLLLQYGKAYLQFQLVRKSPERVLSAQFTCNSDQKRLSVIEGQCIYKDVAYNTAFRYYENTSQSLWLGFDFNLEQTWIKSSSCQQYQLKNSSKTIPCIFLDSEQDKKKIAKAQQKGDNNEAIKDYGLIYGDYYSEKTVHIKIRNSNKFASIWNILKAGLFLADEQDDISLSKTDIMDATLIPQTISNLTDGMLSLYPAKKSFADEFLADCQVKAISIWMNPRKKEGTIAMGNIPYKFVEGGMAKINQSPFNKTDNTIPIITVNYEANGNQQILGSGLNAVICLQCTYLGLPKQILDELLDTIHNKTTCKLNKNKFLTCTKSKKIDNEAKISLLIKKGEFKLELKDFILGKKDNNITFAIRQVEGEKVVFGEVVFTKYFISLDYTTQKMRYGPARRKFGQKLFETLTFIRVIVMLFVGGHVMTRFCHDLVLHAIPKCLQIKPYMRNSIQGKQLRYEIVQDQDLNLDDIKDSMNQYKKEGRMF